MKKLIKIENEYYVVDDSVAIKIKDYIVHQNSMLQVTKYYDNDHDNFDVWLGDSLDGYAAVSDNCIKITHSTKQLKGVVKLEIEDVEEVIYGYSLEDLANKYAMNYNHSLYQFAKDSFKEGFNVHTELVKNKLYTEQDLIQFIDYMYEKKTAHNYKDGQGDFSMFRNLMCSYIKKKLNKTEWLVEIDENNKIILI